MEEIQNEWPRYKREKRNIKWKKGEYKEEKKEYKRNSEKESPIRIEGNGKCRCDQRPDKKGHSLDHDHGQKPRTLKL